MTPDKIIERCDLGIKAVGAGAKVHLTKPGRWRKKPTRRLCKGGPVGKICAELADGKHILVAFSAAEVKTYLEKRKYSNATNR